MKQTKKPHRHRHHAVLPEERGAVRRVKGVKIYEDSTGGSEHTMQYTDGVSENCTSETYIILLMNVTQYILKTKK